MRRIVGAIVVVTCLGVMVHDAGSRRFRTFRPLLDERYVEALKLAMRKGRPLAEVNRIVRMMGNVNGEPGWSAAALHMATGYSYRDVARFLISKGVDGHVNEYVSQT